jgi:predicted transporter
MNLLVSLFGAIILAAVLLLAIGTGLLSKFFKYDLKKHFIITIALSLAIALIISILSPFYETVINLTVYNFYYYIIMALISLILGIVTLYYWSKNQKYDKYLKCILYLDFIPVSYGLFILSSAALSPSFVFNSANISLTITTIHLAIAIAVLLFIISLAAYVLSDFIEDYRITHYPIIYGSMMIIFAFAFIVFGFLIPTISQVIENPSTELTLMPLESGAILIVALAILLGLGVLFRKRNNRLQ